MAHSPCPFRHLLMVDFQTTCEENNQDYPNEIIHFSVAVMDVATNTINDRVFFNQYVRPTINPVLSEFCTRITGVTQGNVETAQRFDDVYKGFYNWLVYHNINERQFAIVCDTRQDMWKIAQYQFRLIRRTLPAFFRSYVNIWRVFKELHPEMDQVNLARPQSVLTRMALFYNVDRYLPAHNAHNDCRTLARVVQRMRENGIVITINETLVCSVGWRRTPVEVDENWRTNFFEAQKVYERVLPLACQAVRVWNHRDYGFCAYCQRPPIRCVSYHNQPPVELYAEQREVITFARVADYY